MSTSTDTTSMSARLASLRQTANTSVRSEETGTTSLKDFLHIYTASSHECYVDYMAGARALHKYLAPVFVPYTGNSVPQLLMNYELTELAKILCGYKGLEDSARLRATEHAIVTTLLGVA